jgi:hypothetical protein
VREDMISHAVRPESAALPFCADSSTLESPPIQAFLPCSRGENTEAAGDGTYLAETAVHPKA